MYQSKISIKNLLWLLFVLSLYIFYGFFIYRPWQQIIEIAYENPIILLQQSHPHAWRLIITYPGLLLNKSFHSEIGFGLYTALIGFLSYLLWYQLGKLTLGKFSIFRSLIFLSLFACMNGRGVFAWFAWLLCIVTCIKLSKSQKVINRFILVITSVPMSLFFATVSSGVFFVVFTSFIVFFSFKIAFCQFRQFLTSLIALIGITVVVSLGSGYLLISTQKNLDFYEIDKLNLSGMIALSKHGIGHLLGFDWFLLFLPVTILAILGVGLYSWVNRKRYGQLFLFYLISLAGGAFGFTTLTLVIPILLSLLNIKLVI